MAQIWHSGVIARVPVFLYHFCRKRCAELDYYEVLDFCAFDVEKAAEMVRQYKAIMEVLDEIGLEKMEPEPDRAACGRLCCPCCFPCARS